jgi:hypothetical protein
MVDHRRHITRRLPNILPAGVRGIDHDVLDRYGIAAAKRMTTTANNANGNAADTSRMLGPECYGTIKLRVAYWERASGRQRPAG